MYFVIYVSSATRPFSQEDLLDLLATSRENNARLNITGMLLYKDGNLMQVLEGEKADVLALYEKIAKDPRHRGLIKLMEGEKAEREFSDWSMAFANLDLEEAKAAPGYSEFLNTSLLDEAFERDPSHAKKLLHLFRRNTK